ncbi:MAG: thiamine pyrophosphate-dependent enzyme [Deltaproteobacteria bacterium]|nr:thiamine pyrophosphate-dependent enzyme [Deltaproteobacteria bacterium]
MRSSDLNVIRGAASALGPDISLEIFRRICAARHFEAGLIGAVKEGFVTTPVYLSTGQESIAAALSLAIPDFMIFAQHRCHAAYLSFGGDPERLRDELMGLSTGTSGGRAGSNCVQCHEENITMHGHHGLIGENVPLAVGAALGSSKPAVCFFGDGAAEEDYVLSGMGFASTHKLPVLFVCEDNNLSILTTVATRRSWSVTKIADALGIVSADLSDDPWTLFLKAQELRRSLPAFINTFTCRANWHVGIGVDGPPEWDRFGIIKEDLDALGLSKEMTEIEDSARASMGKIWDKKLLQRLSGK